MNTPSSTFLPVVVLACAVFRNLLETILPPSLNAQVIFLDYGLHTFPKSLKIALQEAVDAIATPSLVVLGYGLCGNGLAGLRAGPHTLLVPRADDCIAIFLGSYDDYRREFDQHPGTYYLTKGWLESGSDPLREFEKLIDKYGQATAEWLMDEQYRHYKRLVFVAHTQADLDHYAPQARRVGEYMARWGVRYEEMLGSDLYLRQLADATIAAAAGRDGSQPEFVRVLPGGELKQSMFLRL
jgi:hypothetical protein